MKLGVHIWKSNPYSFDLYREKVCESLSTMGVEVIPFRDNEHNLPKVDLIWEPALGGSRVPPGLLMKSNVPVVVTVHGAGTFVLPFAELYSTAREMLLDQLMARLARLRWRRFKKKVAHVITVSAYGAGEVSKVHGLSADQVTSIYHGVDHEMFHPRGDVVEYPKPFLLIVSQYQPVKNVDRVMEAYGNVDRTSKPTLVAILPGYKSKSRVQGTVIIRDKVSPVELAEWYRGALMFVHLSLRETFGLPILEAMASGCPVITSNATGCNEIASDAAVCVDPRNVTEMTAAMQRLCDDNALREDLRNRGMERARQFTWERSAREHLAVFRKALERLQ